MSSDDGSLIAGELESAVFYQEQGSHWRVHLTGWLLARQGQLASFKLGLADSPMSPVSWQRREDLARLWPRVAQSAKCGFQARLPIASPDPALLECYFLARFTNGLSLAGTFSPPKIIRLAAEHRNQPVRADLQTVRGLRTAALEIFLQNAHAAIRLPAPVRPAASVIVLLQGEPAYELACFKALALLHEIEVLAAGNLDGRSAPLLERISGLQITSRCRTGYQTEALCEAAAQARADLLCFIDGRVELLPGAFSAAQRALASSGTKAGAAGAIISDAYGIPLRRRLPEGCEALDAGMEAGAEEREKGLAETAPGLWPFFLTPRSLYRETGGLKPELPPAEAAAEYCERLRRLGKETAAAPGAEAVAPDLGRPPEMDGEVTPPAFIPENPNNSKADI